MTNKLIKMTIKEGAKKETVSGRLVGYIDDDECKAILNTEDAPRKIFTSESILPSDYVGKIIDNRFVFVTYGLGDNMGDKKNFEKKVFISPIIKSIAYIAGNPEYNCGEKIFTLEISQDANDD